MKKILLLSLAAMLVLAFTLPAAAKTTFTASGSLSMGGYYLTNVAAATTSGAAVPTSFMTMDLNLNFKYQINPKLWANVQLSGVDKFWGNLSAGAGRGTAAYGRYENTSLADPIGFNAVEIEVANIFALVYKGWFLIGRGKDASTGSLGPLFQSKVGANRNWSSGDGLYDRIMVDQQFGPWGIFLIVEQKIYEGDAFTGSGDDDLDGYNIVPRYKWKTGAASLSYWYGRYRHSLAFYELNNHEFTGSIWQRVGSKFTVGGKLSVKRNYMKTFPYTAAAAKTTGYYWLLTAEYASGPYKIGGMITVNDGIDSAADTIQGGPGDDFNGLYAAFGDYDGLMRDSMKYTGISDYQTFGDGGAGLQMFLGFAEYKLMEKMWVMAALGFLRWDNTPPAAPLTYLGGAKTLSKNYGTEFDLGANYTIMKGLDLGVHFGYFIPGTFFATGAKGNHLHLDWSLIMKF